MGKHSSLFGHSEKSFIWLIPDNRNSISLSRESSLKGKDQYNAPPCTNQFRSAAFSAAKIFFLFTKQAMLKRRSVVLSPLVRVPWSVPNSLQGSFQRFLSNSQTQGSNYSHWQTVSRETAATAIRNSLLGPNDTHRNIFICAALSKVAKASKALPAACREY